MFQVVVQSAMRQLKAKLKLKLPAPPSNRTEHQTFSKTPKDRTSFILALALGGAILLIALFSN
jgi:hypothetical protein